MIIILDFGSQYSELIARRIREARVYSEVLPHNTSLEKIKEYNPKGIIISGGPASVFDTEAPKCDPNLFTCNIPILGICYGMQLMAKELGGEVIQAETQEYGKANLYIDDNFDLFEGLWLEIGIWMSHGDHISELPKDFEVLATSEGSPFAVIANENKKMYGV